ncbi:MAG: hypothetical protein JXP34_03475, partial [Planctomycetes bacterium]|nr:hypothetical protein [Planctomycetota bacterium]
MKLSLLLRIGIVFGGIALTEPAGAAQRFPPPEFDTGHRLPETETPGRHVALRDSLPAYGDVAILA